MTFTTIRRIYAHAGLQSFVEASGGLFVVGFLVTQGLSPSFALASFALVLLSRFALRAAVLPLAHAYGLRTVLLLGVVIRAGSYIMLPFVSGLGPMLVAFILVSGLGSVLYWTGYHAYVSAAGSNAEMGRQVSIQQAVTATVGIVAPVAGGFLLGWAGATVGFTIIASIQLLAGLPLLGAPNPTINPQSRADPDIVRFGRRIYFAEGLQSGCSNVVWNLALFVTLGQSFENFGGALALAGLGAAAGSLLIGRMIDGGRTTHSLALAYGLGAIVIGIKALAWSTALPALVATALGALVAPMLATAMLSPLYAMAQRSQCTLRFNMATEGGWDLGCSVAALVAAIILGTGFGYTLPILLGLGAIAAIWRGLMQWYRQPDTA
ncbi:MAG: MFS transporter [Novosphingobium sp. 28-62-57]|uniref:MFS transporter n=1 Tax=unclassified Novosphingobium TaxID=2644732 RepID=UPI000BD49951|nr:MULTISPECIES: MFS transporter [unclassified Novosphingobium]OYW51012.1 MAG: MFS transporter [Novosphingobium sp. 12-62-10]OYZ11166.1 MAG: MFS transporter [Novosphingobium sp. 28-62-57]OZA38595.1 MAG: MFS transporter [Novosphingobium sp. 17-62-9]HQS69123.1 MFS transporter [Novosphingobium sp.]